MLIRMGVVANTLMVLLPAYVLSAEQKVTIHRDSWGVPHIYADTVAAGAYGLGYAQAEDRLSDIHTGIRTGMGTMSEAFGKSFVEHDYLMRLCRNSEIAQQAWQGMPEHLQEFVGSFTQGVNDYAKQHPRDVPEYAVALEPWMLLTVGRAR